MRKFTICILCLLISAVPCFSDISLDLSTPKSGFVALRSAVIPGWGQAYNNQHTKAWITFWLFALTTGGAIYFDKEASKKYDEYTAKGLVNSNSYNKYKTDTQISQISLVAAIVFYVFAIVDAYFMFDNKSYSSKLTAFNVYSQNDVLCLEYSYKI
jgi:hypothetical protein